MSQRRRNVLATLGGSLLLPFSGCGESSTGGRGDDAPSTVGPSETTSDTTPVAESATETPSETVEVGADGSIQDAIDEVSDGGEVRVTGDSYSESLTVTKNISLTAPDGATLNGTELGSEAGITIDTPVASVSGLELVEYDGSGIVTESSTEDISITDVAISDLGGGGIDIRSTTASVTDATIEDVGGVGLSIQSTADGSVTVEGNEVNRCDGAGVAISGGKTVTVTNPRQIQNAGRGISVEPGPVRDQTVSVTGGEVLEHDAQGILIEESEGEDTVTIDGVTASDNSGAGISTSGESVTIRNATVAGNGPAGAGIIVGSSADGSVGIRNTTVEQTIRGDYGSPQGQGIRVIDATTVTVENTTVFQSGGWNLRIRTEDVRGQSVSITDSRFEGNDVGAGVSITGSDGEDDVTLTNIEALGHEGPGVNVEADVITLTDSTVSNNGPAGAGAILSSTIEGDVTIRETTVDRTGRGSYGSPQGQGVRVVEAATITVENSTFEQNGGWNFRTFANDTRGQEITVTGSSAEGNNVGAGFSVTGSDGEDTVTFRNVSSVGHANHGFSLGGEIVTLEDCIARDNGGNKLQLTEIDRSAATVIGGNL